MPDDGAVSGMYGAAYFGEAGDPAADGRDLSTVHQLLATLPAGTFVDVGCGAEGALLRRAAAAGWTAVGVEFDAAVAARAARSTGCRVVTVGELSSLPSATATLLNLSDVVEHLRDPLEELRAALHLVVPGGTVTAQGPLEAERNLFTMTLEASMRARGRVGSLPPYHVTLATAAGQRALFRRAPLEEVSFTVTETAWPAPASMGVAGDRRGRALRALRVASTAVTTAVHPLATWGNRYDYVGRVATSRS